MLWRCLPLRVPSSPDLPRFEGCDWVFTTNCRMPVSGFSKVKERLDRLSGVSGWRLHDLRRTGVSALARLGVDAVVADMLLAHQPSRLQGAAKVYQLHDFGPERARALEVWARHVGRCAFGESAHAVVSLEAARAARPSARVRSMCFWTRSTSSSMSSWRSSPLPAALMAAMQSRAAMALPRAWGGRWIRPGGGAARVGSGEPQRALYEPLKGSGGGSCGAHHAGCRGLQRVGHGGCGVAGGVALAQGGEVGLVEPPGAGKLVDGVTEDG